MPTAEWWAAPLLVPKRDSRESIEWLSIYVQLLPQRSRSRGLCLISTPRSVISPGAPASPFSTLCPVTGSFRYTPTQRGSVESKPRKEWQRHTGVARTAKLDIIFSEYYRAALRRVPRQRQSLVGQFQHSCSQRNRTPRSPGDVLSHMFLGKTPLVSPEMPTVSKGFEIARALNINGWLSNGSSTAFRTARHAAS